MRIYPPVIDIQGTLTADDLEHGIPRRCEQCPLARFFQREVSRALGWTEEFARASVSGTIGVDLFDSTEHLATYQARASHHMQDFMEAFDAGETVAPIDVTVRFHRVD